MNRPAETSAVVLVVYRPAQPIEPLLQTLAAQVRTVIVVDNAEQPDAGLADAALQRHATLIHNANAGGLAGAYNRALALLRERGDAVTQVVFLDQDSSPAALRRFLADPQVAAKLTDEHTAAVAPAYRDRATGLRGKYIDLRRFRLSYFPREFSDLRAVAFVINSMSVWRLAALQRIGAFNERLAVDHVDTEYCLRARHLGLAVFVHGGHEFAHAIGERRRFRLFGREMQAGGHGPQRRHLIARNTVWLARTWGWREPAFGLLCLSRLAYEVVGVLIAEEHRPAKLAALVRGACAGLFMRRPT